MSKNSDGSVKRNATSGRFVEPTTVKRGGESYKVTKSAPPKPPAPAIKKTQK